MIVFVIVFVFVFVFTLLGSLWLSFRAQQPKPNLLPGNFLIHNMTSFSFENSWVMGSLKYPQKGPWGAKNMKNLPIQIAYFKTPTRPESNQLLCYFSIPQPPLKNPSLCSQFLTSNHSPEIPEQSGAWQQLDILK